MGKPSDFVQGTLDLLILKTLERAPRHGWAIARRIQEASEDVLQPPDGSLYPALHRLEGRGMIESRQALTSAGRAAKFYSLTSAGRRHLEDEHANWIRLSGAVNAVLQAQG